MLNYSKYRKFSFLILFFLLLITVAGYIFQPNKSNVSMTLFYIIFVMMIISNIIYFLTKRKSNYLDFDSIFILTYCLVGFSATFFYYSAFYKALFLGFPVSVLYINRGNLLFLIGLQSYMLGSLVNCKEKNMNNFKSITTIDTYLLSIFNFILILLFIISGGISSIRSSYDSTYNTTESGLYRYILLLLICTSIVLVSTELYNKNIKSSYNIKYFTLFSLLFTVLILLFAGNRTAASQILLPFLCIYTMYFHHVKFKKFVILMFLGIFSMWFIQIFRENSEFTLSRPILLILDLTIPSRQTYSAIEYVEINGYTFGKTMSLGLIGIIPFLASFITKGDMTQYGSAELLTNITNVKYSIPEEARIGLGTTIIGDIYLSFGLIGVILLMLFLGYFINKLILKSVYNDYYSLLMYSSMAANSIFIVRASYTHPIRFMVWSLIIAFVFKLKLK